MEKSKCVECRRKKQTDGGWCYMWKTLPEFDCHYFKKIKTKNQNKR